MRHHATRPGEAFRGSSPRLQPPRRKRGRSALHARRFATIGIFAAVAYLIRTPHRRFVEKTRASSSGRPARPGRARPPDRIPARLEDDCEMLFTLDDRQRRELLAWAW